MRGQGSGAGDQGPGVGGQGKSESISESAASSNGSSGSGVAAPVAYLGPQGSFCHEAASRFFSGSAHELMPCANIRQIFEAVRTERAPLGVAPIESLRQGPVIETYMELKKAGPSRIAGETYLPIQLFLILHPDAMLDSVTHVRSKAEALRQCGNWLDAQQERRREAGLPLWSLEEYSSTAKAAEWTAEHPESAAVSSRFVTEFYDVKTVGRDELGHTGIQDLPDGASYTRFLILGQTSPTRAEHPDQRFKTSFRFILSHRTGALVDALLPFREAGISVEDIQPMPFRATRRQIEYVFFMDFMGHIADEAMIRAVREAEETCAVEYLGSYLAGEMPQAALGPPEG
jgi:chorismate mutase/prephenate dehydratase